MVMPKSAPPAALIACTWASVGSPIFDLVFMPLKPRSRAIVTMRYFDEVPSKAIASSMGLSEARISQLLARATSQLKVLLTERSGELDLAA